ncbi:hypothetical protein [Halocatena salina]|uniref:Uncharacterized protein n=1 Tax=Halocatena salina TaxID=2934340 RepID=A0A8U0A0D0_9EURY|nr:hypothetical protein [Halocatena salina]UPM42550.1 hypothetical protein MW046_11375 [Halocatena salina]
MIVTTNLASAVLMGVFLVAVVGVVIRLRANRGEPTRQATVADLPQTAVETPRSTAESGPDVGSSATPIGWVIGFLGLVAIAGGGAVAFIAGNAPSGIGPQAIGAVLVVVLGGLLCSYLFSGIYLSLRSHGRKSAEATGVALWLLGLLVVVVIATRLVFLA